MAPDQQSEARNRGAAELLPVAHARDTRIR